MKVHTIVVVACLALTACGEGTKDETRTQPGALDCGAGALFDFLDDEVCVYDGELADLEFECPETVPIIDYFDGFVVCSEDGVDASIEEAVYEAHPELRPEPPAPCTEDSYAPNHSESTAKALMLGESYDLIVCPEQNFEEQWDYWTVELAAGQWVTAILTSDNYAMDIRPTENPAPGERADRVFAGIAGSSYVGPWRRTVGAVTYRAEEATTYEFHVARLFGSEYEAHEYHLELVPGCLFDADCGEGLACNRQLLACLPPAEPACGDDAAEPNNSDATATPITTDGAALTGLALCDEDFDLFSLSTDVGDSLEITVEHDQGDDGSVAVFLIRADGSVEASEARPSHEGTVFRMPHLRGGAYYLLVDGVRFDSGQVNYDLSVSKAAGACSSNLDCSHLPTRERAQCADDGSCQGVPGRADIAIGEQCDDEYDCVEGSYCGYYTGDTADKWVCTVSCESDDMCGGLNGGYCHPGECSGESGDCLPGCDQDADCPDDLACTDGRCTQCESDAECGDDTCVLGVCVSACDDHG